MSERFMHILMMLGLNDHEATQMSAFCNTTQFTDDARLMVIAAILELTADNEPYIPEILIKRVRKELESE